MSQRARLPLFFDSQVAAAARLGLPIELLKAAKDAGCGCFHSGRVYPRGLRAWLRRHGGQLQPRRGGRALREVLLEEQIRKLELANRRLAQQQIPRERLLVLTEQFRARVLPQVERILTVDYPELIHGLDTPGIRLKGKQVFDRLLDVFREASRCWEGW